MKKNLRKSQSGQTLLMGLMSLVVLLFAIFFLFDLHSIIKAKFKSKTSVDAAALVGANWQRYTLNMVGDINLVKASTLMLTDIPGAPGLPFDTPEKVEELKVVSNNLSEMQQRILFVGPAIGFGAAQQAAKYNGLGSNEMFNQALKDHLIMVNGEVYMPPNVNPILEQYEWRIPYWDMLHSVYDQGKGVAVAVNSTSVLYPSLNSTSPQYIHFLTSKRIYEAITYNYWCDLRYLLRLDFSAKWWGDISLSWNSSGFIGECEFFPVGVNFAQSSSIYQNAMDLGVLSTLLEEKGHTPLSEQFDEYDPLHPGDKDQMYNPLPHIKWALFDNSTWYGYDQDLLNTWSDYLRSSIRDEYAYRGCHAYVWAEVEPTTISGSVIPVKSDLTTQRARASANRLQSAHHVYATALAKPLGSLKTNDGTIAPQAAGRFILPCFERSVLIPVSLEPESGVDPFDYKWYAFLTEYLPALGTCNSLDEMGPEKLPDPSKWSWFIYYHNALKKLDDPAWRQQGIDWLDTPILDKDGKKTGTYEDTCDKPDRGGGGSGPSSGPGKLH